MAPNMEYKTPQTTFTEAINFDSAAGTNKGQVGKSISSLHAKFNNVMSRLNNSEFIYPTASVLAMTVMTIMFVFGHGGSIIMKCCAVLLLLLFVIYTVYQYRYK